MEYEEDTRPLLWNFSSHKTAYGSGSVSHGKLPITDEKAVSLKQLLTGMSWRNRMTAVTAALVIFIAMACFAIMAPFMPLEAEEKGLDSTTVGIIFACFEAVMIIANIVFGQYLTTIGARFTYISGIFIGATCTVLFGTLQWCPPGTPFIVMAIFCRSLEAAGCSMCQTASMAIVANEFPDHVATVMGLLETFVGFGSMVGPPIGGVLYELGGFYLPFVVIGTVFFVIGVVALVILPEPVMVPPKDRRKLFLSFIKIPTTLICGLCILTCSTMLTFLDPVFAQQLASVDPTLSNSQSLIGLIFLAEPTIYAILSPFIGYISDNSRHPLAILAVGNVGFIIAYLFLGPCPLFLAVPQKQLWLTICSYGTLGLCISLSFMPAFSAMTKGCIEAGLPNDLDLYGLIAGFFSAAYNLGSFIGPIFGGVLTQHFGFEWATSIIALAPLIDLIVLTIFGIFYWK